MAAGKIYLSSSRRKRRKRKTYRAYIIPKPYKHNMLISRRSAPLPLTLRTKMKYIDHMTMNPGPVFCGTQVYKLNSMYDPDQTGVGTQPRGWDELAALYTDYIVNYVTIKLCVANTTNTEYGLFITGITLLSQLTTLDTQYDYCEQANTNWKAMTGFSGSRGLVTVKHSCTPYKFFNLPKNDDTLQPAVTADPESVVYAHCFYQCATTGVDNSSADCWVEINYDVTFTKPKPLLGS